MDAFYNFITWNKLLPSIFAVWCDAIVYNFANLVEVAGKFGYKNFHTCNHIGNWRMVQRSANGLYRKLATTENSFMFGRNNWKAVKYIYIYPHTTHAKMHVTHEQQKKRIQFSIQLRSKLNTLHIFLHKQQPKKAKT